MGLVIEFVGLVIGCVDLGCARHGWEESCEESPWRFSAVITTVFERRGCAGSCGL